MKKLALGLTLIAQLLVGTVSATTQSTDPVVTTTDTASAPAPTTDTAPVKPVSTSSDYYAKPCPGC